MEPVFNIRFTRNGGMTFLRVGRLQWSFCVCSSASTAKAFPTKSAFVAPAILDCHEHRLALPRQYADVFINDELHKEFDELLKDRKPKFGFGV